MLDDDGNILDIEPHEKYIMEEHETIYLSIPSFESGEAHIDAVLDELNENNLNSDSVCHSVLNWKPIRRRMN